VLNYWIENWTLSIRGRIESLKLDPSNTLLALTRTIRANGGAEFETPFRAWALHDPMASEAVAKVDSVRLEFIRSEFGALGFEGAEAENRARLYLAYEMSAPSIFAKPDEELDEQLLIERHRFLTEPRSDLRE